MSYNWAMTRASRGELTTIVQTRVSPEQRALLESAADKAGVKLGEWLREVALAAATQITTGRRGRAQPMRSRSTPQDQPVQAAAAAGPAGKPPGVVASAFRQLWADSGSEGPAPEEEKAPEAPYGGFVPKRSAEGELLNPDEAPAQWWKDQKEGRR